MRLGAFGDKKILMIRHGKTGWNAEGRFQGHSDVPLNDEGVEQARCLAERLRPFPLDVVYTSVLSRAQATAKAIAEPHGLTPIVVDGLIEVGFGEWEGCYIEQMRREIPAQIEAWYEDPFFNMPTGGETWDHIEKRAVDALSSILSSPETNIAVISHGGTIRAIYAVLLSMDPHSVWNIRSGNCSLSGIEIRKGRASLAFANDDLHTRGVADYLELPVW